MKVIPLKSGGDAMVDDHWFDYLSQWSTWRLVGGSVCRTEVNHHGKQVTIHMRRVVRDAQKKDIVRHYNNNPLDCQEENLELTDRRTMYLERFRGSGSFTGGE